MILFVEINKLIIFQLKNIKKTTTKYRISHQPILTCAKYLYQNNFNMYFDSTKLKNKLFHLNTNKLS